MDLLSNAFISTHFESNSLDPNGLLREYEQGLCKAIFEKLWAVYPGYDWKVRVDARQGIASVKLPRLHRSTLGYNFPVAALESDVSFVHVIRAGGELLERFQLRRGRATKAEYVDRIQKAGRVFGQRDEVPGGMPSAANENRSILLAA